MLSDPMFIGSSSANTGTAGTTMTVNKPSNLQDGDFMIMNVGYASGATLTTLSGWTAVGSTQATTNTHSSAYFKVASGEGASYTWTFTGTTSTYAVVIAAYRVLTPTSGTFLAAQAGATSTTAQSVVGPTTVTISANPSIMVYMRTTRDCSGVASNVQNSSSDTGVVKRVEDVLTIAATVAHGATIWDRLYPHVGTGGTQAGITTACGTVAPTEGTHRTLAIVYVPQSDLEYSFQAIQRQSRW